MNARFALAPLLALASFAAQADVTFAFGAAAENLETWTFNYQQPGAQTTGVLSTGGPLVASVSNVSASVNAWADARTGMFKAITTVNIDGSQQINIANAYARLDLSDTLRFSGSGPTTRAEFTLSYDTELSGLGFAAFDRVNQISHFQQVWSFRTLSLSYEVANPSYDPTAVCTDYGSDGIYCPPETQPFITRTASASNDQFREVALGGPGGVYTNGSAVNGRYTGAETLAVDLPNGVDVRLEYTVYNTASCFHLAQCNLVNDASHSDYLSLTAAGNFSSSNGYQYLGMAAAVPEPASVWLSLVGAVIVIGIYLRRREA